MSRQQYPSSLSPLAAITFKEIPGDHRRAADQRASLELSLMSSSKSPKPLLSNEDSNIHNAMLLHCQNVLLFRAAEITYCAFNVTFG